MTHDQFSYSDIVNITIYKVTSKGVFTHWEAEIYDLSLEKVAQYTGPTYGSVLDEAVGYINEEYPDWIKENANDKITPYPRVIPKVQGESVLKRPWKA